MPKASATKKGPTLREICEHARKQDAEALKSRKAFARFVHLQDARARRLASAWSNYPTPWTRPTNKLVVDRGSTWKRRTTRAVRWAWQGNAIDFDELAAAAGLLIVECYRYWKVLAANRLIYPDGTLSPVTEDYLSRKGKAESES